MKRVVWFTLLAVMASTGLASAEGIGLGVGAYGGVSFPIIQDDTGGGGVFGLRAPVRVIPLITVEPFYLTSSLKDVDEEIGGVTYTRSGFDGWTTTSPKYQPKPPKLPVKPLTSRRVHETPPLSERKRPRP